MRNKLILLFIFALIFELTLITSCDDNESNSSNNLINIKVIHDIEDGLNEEIVTKRFTGFDKDGEIVYGPFEEKRSATISLEGVPVETAFILTEYINDQGVIVSGTLVPVDIEPGKNLEIILTDDPTAPVHFAKTGDKFALMVVQNNNSNNSQKITEQDDINQNVFIKGVGFDYNLKADFDSTSDKWFSYVDPDIKNVNANSIRTYGVGWNFADPTTQAELISKMLKFASDNSTNSNFITVLAGLVYDPSQGDMEMLITETVKKVQMDENFDHLLKWVIGNEVNKDKFSGLNKVVKAVKETAKKNSKLKRPVGTALPTVSEGFVTTIQSDLPDIDWLGINTFYGEYDSTHKFTGFLDMQAANLSTGGWIKPWSITEYYSYDLPAPGIMPNQMLNGKRYYLELNSTLNADNYTRSYTDYIASTDAISKGSIGGYVLNWGPPHNSKLVAFWKEVYTYDGQFQAFVNPPWTGGQSFNKLGAYDAVYDMYVGTPNPSQSPQIVLPTSGDRQGIGCPAMPNGTCPFWATLNTDPTVVNSGQSLTAQITATSSSQELKFNWYLTGGTSTGGNGFSGDILAPQNNPQDFTSTTTGGNDCPTNNPTTCGMGGSPMNGQLNVCSGGSNDGQECQTNTDCTGGGSCAVNTTSNSGTWTSILNFNAPQPASSGNNYQLRVVILDGQGGAATAAVGFPMQ